MIDIRPATVDDVPALAALRWEFRAGRATATEDRSAFLARCAEWMRTALIGDWRAWVAVDGDRAGGVRGESDAIVGHVWLCAIGKIPNPSGQRERQAYISNFYVRPTARGGLGRRLLQQAIDWADANGVEYALLTPTPRSRGLYGRHGFHVSEDWLIRPVRGKGL
jgi:GNAT superfamily N-acetyltransferase